MFIHSDPERAAGYTDPDIEVFYNPDDYDLMTAEDDGYEAGFYWWSCFPGCLPDGEPIGPFDTEAEAIADAQSY